jgi:hypothetical protein
MQVVDANGNMFGYDHLEIIGVDGKPKTTGGGGGPYVPYTGATGDVDLGEYELKAGQLELDQTPTGTAGVAVMRWNDQDGTADLGLKGGNVTLQIGQEQVTRVVNKTGSDLLEANYQAVRISGAQGNRLKVDLAQANNDANSADTIGIVTETILNNQEGFVTTSGLVRNIDTTGTLQGETWLDGNLLYLSGTIAGQITNVKPTAPIHTVIMGYVVRAHATQGQIYVKVDNGYELDELHNVAITSPANNDLLQYDSATSLWKNESLSSAGIQPSITLTTTGTSGAATLVGATLNIPQYGGGGGGGVHGFLTPSGMGVTAMVITSGTNTAVPASNTMYAYPIIMAKDYTFNSMQMYCQSLLAGANARILIYSDLNSAPNTKLYESTTIDLSTTGTKTITNTMTFTKGTIYWMVLHCGNGGSPLSIRSMSALTTMPIGYQSNNATYNLISKSSIPLGSAPTTFGASSVSTLNAPLIALFQ